MRCRRTGPEAPDSPAPESEPQSARKWDERIPHAPRCVRWLWAGSISALLLGQFMGWDPQDRVQAIRAVNVLVDLVQSLEEERMGHPPADGQEGRMSTAQPDPGPSTSQRGPKLRQENRRDCPE